jgi:hypothetical protein
MNDTGDNWLKKARLQPATAAGGLLSLFAVVAGLAMSLFCNPWGVALIVIGAVWSSWIDHHKRPEDMRVKELSDRIDSMQSKINSLMVRSGMGGV